MELKYDRRDGSDLPLQNIAKRRHLSSSDTMSSGEMGEGVKLTRPSFQQTYDMVGRLDGSCAQHFGISLDRTGSSLIYLGSSGRSPFTMRKITDVSFRLPLNGGLSENI